MPTRRNFLKSGAALLAAGLAADAAIFEPDYPRLVRVDMPLQRLPEAWNGLRIVQLSDFHYDPVFSVHPIRKAVEIVQSLKPDLVMLTGDFITDTTYSRKLISDKRTGLDVQLCAELLGSLQSRLGSYAILGNHDVRFNANIVIEALESLGIRVLRNSALALEQNNSRLWLTGIDDALEGAPDLVKIFKSLPKDELTIMLAHEPDFALETAKYNVDLQLSGHSHGGQIRIPLIGALYLPELAHTYPRGFYEIGNMKLYTNVGLGTITVPFRFDCPPEITLFTLGKTSN
ncbi:MAG TPA: metallophosphoesterase [Terriglobales bacterium]